MMITTLAWYNVIALIVGAFFVNWFYVLAKDRPFGSFQKWLSAMKKLIVLLLAVVFYTIWGGVFWW